jgi:hypothetical protein
MGLCVLGGGTKASLYGAFVVGSLARVIVHDKGLKV